ncbi:MAG: hypothetical protein H7A32_04295 [Deltaproteobacteria bacterium]|nr:hypothetical protein [Deltaproteobacteria bacterium]
MAKILKGNDFKKNLDLEALIENEFPASVNTVSTKGGIVDRQSLEASSEAQKIIEEAREDARKIRQEAREVLAKIQEESNKAKKAAYELGFAEGQAAGTEMLIKVKELRQKLFEDNEREILKLIFEIAKKIIGREFRENDKAILNVIRLALSDAIGDKIIIRLNPQDYKKIKKFEEEFFQSIEEGKSIVFREKDDVQEGGCIVETEIGTIDAQLDTQLSAIKKALGL